MCVPNFLIRYHLESNKGMFSNDNIIIEAATDISLNDEKGDLINIKAKDELRDEQVLVEMLNNHHINTVEKASRIAPKSLGNPSDPEQDKSTVQNIVQYYQNHPSIKKIKVNFQNLNPFDFPESTVKDISKIIKSLNPKKATGPDGIPIKIIKYASNAIDSQIYNIYKSTNLLKA